MKALSSFFLKLIGFSGLLCAIHYYIILNFFADKELYFPIWTIYVFNAVLVFAVYAIISNQVSKGSTKAFQLFMGATLVKMVLILIFLLPIFMGKSDNKQLETFNFFLPYFLFLGFEIFALNKFFKNEQTK